MIIAVANLWLNGRPSYELSHNYYAQELFEQEELTGYLKNMLMNTGKSVYEHVVYDSDTEWHFADELEKIALSSYMLNFPAGSRYRPRLEVTIQTGPF